MRTGGLALNEAGNESGDRWSGEKKKTEKEKKRDSLMLFRPLVRCVGRPFRCPRQRGIRVRSYRFEKRYACFPVGGRGEERRNSRTKVETSRPSLDEERRT